jgi:putative membrane protein insertion efficiency factor
LTALACGFSLLAVTAASASPEKMKAPDARPIHRAEIREPETMVSKIVLLGAVSFFQRYISPTDGDRCGFTPTCSAFGREAVRREGAFAGVLVTADRLMRCTYFKRPGPDYLLLPSGKLYDPVENNLLHNP